MITRAIALLVAALGTNFSPLAWRDYRAVARWLAGEKLTPEDLLRDAPAGVVKGASWVAGVSEESLRGLLGRGFTLALREEGWRQRGIWMASRADTLYPRVFRGLGWDSPPIFWGAGAAAPTRQLVAVVGSRDLTAAEAEVAAAVGRSAARRGLTLVSGGARGADRIAMDACLRAGGRVIGILPRDLNRAAVDAGYRAGIRDGRLTLLSPWEPEAPWVTEHAFARNALIYAAADAAAIVVAAQEGRGGTWGGVSEYLATGKNVPVYVNPAAKAAKALAARGASPLPKDWLQ